jgi:hypothetical protein
MEADERKGWLGRGAGAEPLWGLRPPFVLTLASIAASNIRSIQKASDDT